MTAPTGVVAKRDSTGSRRGNSESRVGSPASVLMIAYTNYENDPRVIRAAEAAVGGGLAVDVIALRRPGQGPVEVIRGVRVLRLNQERYRGRSRLRYLLAYAEFFLRCAVASSRLFWTKRYRVIHVNNMPDVLVFSVVLPKLLGARVILDIHDPMPETFSSKFDRAERSAVRSILSVVEKLSVAFADATITVSEPVRNGILARRGYRAQDIGVVANFADDEIFRPMAVPPVGEKIRFVFHGTILERYGLRTVVEAVSKVRHREMMHVRIIGEGDFSTSLAELIRTYDVGDVIEFVNHMYPLHHIPTVLADCHVGLVPLDVSKIAQFALPLKLLEYTCLGMPSISARNVAIEHYFRPEECMFFDSGDALALAEILDRVAEKPECLADYRQRVEVARQRLSWSGERAKYQALLRELGGGSPRGWSDGG
jgi:glycosyltransferase involved in cell wall biosynthesis